MIYSVIYGNYYPREVDSQWATREEAVARMNELNDDPSPPQSRMWEIEELAGPHDEQIARLEREVKVLREGLEHYADRGKWAGRVLSDFQFAEGGYSDGGDLARSALAQADAIRKEGE